VAQITPGYVIKLGKFADPAPAIEQEPITIDHEGAGK
jgi:hypothetical protein